MSLSTLAKTFYSYFSWTDRWHRQLNKMSGQTKGMFWHHMIEERVELPAPVFLTMAKTIQGKYFQTPLWQPTPTSIKGSLFYVSNRLANCGLNVIFSLTKLSRQFQILFSCPRIWGTWGYIFEGQNKCLVLDPMSDFLQMAWTFLVRSGPSWIAFILLEESNSWR